MVRPPPDPLLSVRLTVMGRHLIAFYSLLIPFLSHHTRTLTRSLPFLVSRRVPSYRNRP